MNRKELPQSRPSPTPHPSDRQPLLWAVITALTAAAAFGVVVPRLVGLGHAHAGATPRPAAMSSNAAMSKPTPPSATRHSTVPAASDVFVDPESGVIVGALAPTF